MRCMTQDLLNVGWAEEQVRQVGAAIRALRGAQSTKAISDKTEKLGQRVNRSTLTDIEIGRRKYIAVHELSLIAAALGVSPAKLLMHDELLADDEVQFLPEQAAPASKVAKWWGNGSLPSPRRDAGAVLDAPSYSARDRGLLIPDQRRFADDLDQVDARVRRLETAVQRVENRVAQLEARAGAKDSDGPG